MMKHLGLALAFLAFAQVAFAGQVPNPINAPASVGSGDVLSASGTNPQQAADSGIAANTVVTLAGSQTLTNKTLTSPTMTTPTLGAAGATSVTVASGAGLFIFGTAASISNSGAVIEFNNSASSGTGGTLDAAITATSTIENRSNGSHIWESATAPTVTSGLGTSPTVTGNGAWAVVITVGASGTPSTSEVLAMPAAAAGWVCNATDRTTNVTARETATATNSVTFTWSSAPSNSDVIQHQCVGY